MDGRSHGPGAAEGRRAWQVPPVPQTFLPPLCKRLVLNMVLVQEAPDPAGAERGFLTLPRAP